MKPKGNKAKVYKHNHTHNKNARESDERKLSMLKNMEVRRLQKAVCKQVNIMRNYLPPDANKQEKDPAYVLKGAARPAQPFYEQPNLQPEIMEVDLIEQYISNMWDHNEGQILLRLMLELSVALHNISNRSKEAVENLSKIISYDPQDHLLARNDLLRCYLDEARGEDVRKLLTQFAGDCSALFVYSRAFIEFISYGLSEEGASMEIADEMLLKAYAHNPCVLWFLAYPEEFSAAIESSKDSTSIEITTKHAPQGSLEEAFILFEVDAGLWRETEGAVQWCKAVIHSQSLVPPTAPNPSSMTDVFAAALDLILDGPV